MPGTVKIWWHDGAVRDVRYNGLPVVNEPELAFEAVTLDGTGAVSTGTAPIDTVVAIVESDVDLRYRVVEAGGGAAAAVADSKPLRATGVGTESIGVYAGQTISFLEV